jgi:hypothetical protein
MAEKDYSNYPVKPSSSELSNERKGMVKMYEYMQTSGTLAGFKKDNPKGHAALKKVYDTYSGGAAKPAKPAAKKDAPSVKPAAKAPAKPVAKPAAKPVAKKAAPAKKK